MRMFKHVAMIALALTLTACANGKVVATPTQAAEAGHDVTAIVREASSVMLTAYKAGQVPATVADPFFEAVDLKVLPISRRVKTAVAAWHAAAEGVTKVKAGENLNELLQQLENEAKLVFGMALPAGVGQSIGNIASNLYDAIGKIRALITAARAGAADPSPALAQ